ENLRERPDGKNLYSQQRENHAENHGVDVQNDASRNLARSGQQPEDKEQAGRQQRSARQQKDPIRRIQQHEPQVPPAVPKTAQVRGPSPRSEEHTSELQS